MEELYRLPEKTRLCKLRKNFKSANAAYIVMATYMPAFSARLANASRRGFSLVEVAIAIAILAIAMVALIGLLPSGMSNFQQAMDTTVTSQIAQSVLHDAGQAEFNDLIDLKSLPGDPTGQGYCPERFSFRAPRVEAPGWRYFDVEGKEIRPKSQEELSKSEKLQIVKQLNTRIRPQAELPMVNESGSQVAQLTVQVARNPILRELPLNTDENSPEFNLFKATKGLQVYTFSGLVGRNQGR